MGIKMSYAKCNGRRIDINQYDPERSGKELKCYYCNADVTFVNTYEKEINGSIVIVQRHFRLKPKKNHETGCRYTVDGELLDIYARLADNELMTRQGDIYVVRLMFNSDEEKRGSSINISDVSGHGKREYNYISSGKKAVYLSTINRIMRIKALVEDDNELRDKIRFIFYRKSKMKVVINWELFFFNVEVEKDSVRLLKCLQNNLIDYPICVGGRIKLFEEKSPQKTCVKLEFTKVDRNGKLSVEIYIHDAKSQEMIKTRKGKKIYVYVSRQSYKEKTYRVENRADIVYHNVYIDVYDAKQIFLEEI